MFPLFSFLSLEAIAASCFSSSLFWAVEARAQVDAGVAMADAEAAPEPPRALTIATVAWPHELTLPDARLRRARVCWWVAMDSLSSNRVLCRGPLATPCHAALMESEFVPAQIAGEPIAHAWEFAFPVLLGRRAAMQPSPRHASRHATRARARSTTSARCPRRRQPMKRVWRSRRS